MTGLSGGQWVRRGATLHWRKRPPAPKGPRELAPVSCGTEEGYQRHRYLARRKEPGAVWPLPADDPCGCRAAHAAHNWPPAEARAEAC